MGEPIPSVPEPSRELPPVVGAVAIGLVGVVAVTFGSGFRAGAYCVAGLMAALALARAVCPNRWLTGLIIRTRRFDVATLGLLAGAVAFLAATTPDLG
jgi:hypothetical protein